MAGPILNKEVTDIEMQDWLLDSVFTTSVADYSSEVPFPNLSGKVHQLPDILQWLIADNAQISLEPETTNLKAPASHTLSTVFTQEGVLGCWVSDAPDMALYSSDSVLFYVHSIFVSQSCMWDLISPRTPPAEDLVAAALVSETSEVVNVLLHAIYQMQCSQFMPSLAVLTRVMEIISPLQFNLDNHTEASSPLYVALLALAPMHTIEVYAIAAQYNLEHLAIPVSSHLLSFDLSSLTDATSNQIGPKYLRKLFFLHLGRMEALKRSIMILPTPHAPLPECAYDGQRKLQGLWMQSMANLAWDRRPDLAPSLLELAFKSEIRTLECAKCKKALEKRVRDMVVEWTMVKRTI